MATPVIATIKREDDRTSTEIRECHFPIAGLLLLGFILAIVLALSVLVLVRA